MFFSHYLANETEVGLGKRKGVPKSILECGNVSNLLLLTPETKCCRRYKQTPHLNYKIRYKKHGISIPYLDRANSACKFPNFVLNHSWASRRFSETWKHNPYFMGELLAWLEWLKHGQTLKLWDLSPAYTTLIHHRAFRKRSSNRWNLKTSSLNFSVNGEHFKNRASRKRWRHDDHVISLPGFPWNTNLNNLVPRVLSLPGNEVELQNDRLRCFQTYPAWSGRSLVY